MRLDEFTAVAVPEAATEAASDLVRAPEDCRADLMRSRNRTSKLLLRHGIVYCGDPVALRKPSEHELPLPQ